MYSATCAQHLENLKKRECAQSEFWSLIWYSEFMEYMMSKSELFHLTFNLDQCRNWFPKKEKISNSLWKAK